MLEDSDFNFLKRRPKRIEQLSWENLDHEEWNIYTDFEDDKGEDIDGEFSKGERRKVKDERAAEKRGE